MANDPKKPVDEKVGAYDNDRPARGGGGGSSAIITVVLIILAVLLILWLFTDIL